MIDPVTGWFEMAQINDKTIAKVANMAKLTCITHYPYPKIFVLDREK